MLCGLGTDHHTCACNRISVLWINGLSFRHDLWGATPARSHMRQWWLFSERLKWSSIANFSHLNRERTYTMRSSYQKVTQHCSLVTRERTNSANISCKNEVLIIEELILRLSDGQTMIWRWRSEDVTDNSSKVGVMQQGLGKSQNLIIGCFKTHENLNWPYNTRSWIRIAMKGRGIYCIAIQRNYNTGNAF